MTRSIRRPLVAAALALAALACLTPVAYAVVDRIFLTVDPTASAEEVAASVRQQLEAAGVPGVDVQAEKQGDAVKLMLSASGDAPAALAGRLTVVPSGGRAEMAHRQLRVEAACELSDADQARLTAAVTSPAVLDQLDDAEPDALRAAMVELLAQHGFHDVRVAASGDDVTVEVLAPPAP